MAHASIGQSGRFRVSRVGHEIHVELPDSVFGGEAAGTGWERRGPFLPLLRIDEALRNAGLGVVVSVNKRNTARPANDALQQLLEQHLGAYLLELHSAASDKLWGTCDV